MSFQLRRLVALALAALALTAGATATATAASASAPPAQAVNQPAADDFDGYPGEGLGHGHGHGHGHGQERPLHFGPFEIPRDGTVSGGFSWGMRG
ncbi:hypothetical protein ACFFS2_00715 [Streptomyces aurantiacus]|uniref:Secreted protein n=1 Tax=Streptomyces aurantiacus TaxID=47760 RepID=A0A7G1NW91_9ACTN|nr:hypothetical protein [Streptomyces aurantiacus]BCL26681.1 hypothetical protein GCM10017557_15400 [Streptomyces aurantiacus]